MTASVRPLPVNERIGTVDQWVMLAAAVALFLSLLTGRRINRVEGALLLGGYGVYIATSYLGAAAQP